MSETIKPIILDETGKKIIKAIEENSATILAAQTASYDEDVTLAEVKDARTIGGNDYPSLGLALRREFTKREKLVVVSSLQPETEVPCIWFNTASR